MVLLGLRVTSRINRFSLFRSTARFAIFFATAIPRLEFVPDGRSPKYKPQALLVFGFAFSNSDMRALFK
jgi:hypothetical protein